MSPLFKPKFVILTILDGWGIAPSGPGNAITQSKTPNFNKFWNTYPHTQLDASGQAVGLPKGEDGNTETGHLNLGAGRIVYQDLERITMSIADGSFFEKAAFNEALDHVSKNNSSLHLMGLIGAGGVHSSMDHLYALIHLASKNNIKNLYIHLFTDGRDSPPTLAKTYISQVQNVIQKEGVGVIASLMGRYWAMDRDQRWDRTEKAYLALTEGQGHLFKTPGEAVDDSYSRGKTDEFIEPSLISTKEGNPVALIKDNDAVIFFNFRIDRPRQLTKAFVMEEFENANVTTSEEATHQGNNANGASKNYNHQKPFSRTKKLTNLFFVTMTEYSRQLAEEGAKPAYSPEVVVNPLSQVVSSHDFKQLKITESEKERFVTFYFNGLRDKPFLGEDRVIIPSPKVPTYDLKPEMSSEELTQRILIEIESGLYKLIVINYPNADMVAHTGNIEATIKSVEALDSCVGRVANLAIALDGLMIITADHGNAEEMINLQTNGVDTEHSTNPVPFLAISRAFLGKNQKLTSGVLADIATTILSLLEISVPVHMTGRDLLKEVNKY